MAFDSQGRLMVGGSVSGPSSQDALVMRLNGDGSIDQTFGDHGVVTRDIDHASSDLVKQLFVDAQGHVIAAGLAGQEVGLVSLLADGSGNSGFGDLMPGATVSGQLQAYDVDAANYSELTWAGSAGGTYGALTMQSNGAWTYQVDNSLAATQGIGHGQAVTDTFTVN